MRARNGTSYYQPMGSKDKTLIVERRAGKKKMICSFKIRAAGSLGKCAQQFIKRKIYENCKVIG